MQAGAAAVVQGQRTSDRDIQSQVAAYETLRTDNGLTQNAAPTDADRAQVARAQINFLVQTAVWQKVADGLGVTVGPADDAKLRSTVVEETRSALGPDFHGSDNEAVSLAFAKTQQPNYLAPSAVPGWVHYQALIKAVVADEAAKLKVDPELNDQASQTAMQQAVIPLLDQAAKEIDVKISPRYGTFDAASRQLVTADTSWLRPTEAQIAGAMAQMQQPAQ
ncbi:hypothetical protein ACFQ9X_53370 [Catenulispora yoronensis]